MLRYRFSRLQWILKHGILVLLRHLLRWRVYLQPAHWPTTVNGITVVIDRCLGIGDVLMISPALRLLLDHGPLTVVAHLPRLLDAELAWHTTKSWQEQQTTVNRLVDDGNIILAPFTGLRGTLALLTWPGTLPPGAIVLNDYDWLDTVSGAIGKVSGSHYSDPPLAAAQGLACRLSASLPQTVPVLRLPPLMTDTARLATMVPISPFIALAPWAAAATRRWRLSHWAQLIDLLVPAHPNLHLVLLGSNEERIHGEEILSQARAGHTVINLMGRLTLAETAATLNHARLLVCCDSGLMHIALGLDTPIVALFGSTDPQTRLAGNSTVAVADLTLCPRQLAPCYVGLQRDPACPSHVECLSLLQPERIAAQVSELIKIKT
ncbi:hypothetical protein CCP3SC15_80035 [Gammaproteobacteria bacterium]